MTLPLSRPYPCRFGAPVIDRVDPRIFRLTYFKECMACTFCHDGCCQWGVDIELPRVAAIERHRAELEAYLGVPRSRWFREDPSDFGVLDEPDDGDVADVVERDALAAGLGHGAGTSDWDAAAGSGGRAGRL